MIIMISMNIKLNFDLLLTLSSSVVAAAMMMFRMPQLFFSLFRAVLRGDNIQTSQIMLLGKDRIPFRHTVLKINNRAQPSCSRWLNVFRGNMNIVGPRPLTLEQAVSEGIVNGEKGRRFLVKPGLVNCYRVKKQAGIAFESEARTESNFASSYSPIRALQLLFVHLLGLFLSVFMKRKISSSGDLVLFGVRINNHTMEEAVQWIMQNLQQERKSKIAFVNAGCANKFYKDIGYRDTLANYDKVFADGVGVKMAGLLYGKKIKQNVNGTDMFPLLCKQLAEQGRSVFFLGALPGVGECMSERLVKMFPDLKIAGVIDGYSMDKDSAELIEHINAANPDVLFVAFGAPVQEKWIARHLPDLDTSVAIGVGGLFDFYSGEIARAPVWMREMSLEWLWRFMMEPKAKFNRYFIGNPLFIYRLLVSLKGRRQVKTMLSTVKR